MLISFHSVWISISDQIQISPILPPHCSIHPSSSLISSSLLTPSFTLFFYFFLLLCYIFISDTLKRSSDSTSPKYVCTLLWFMLDCRNNGPLNGSNNFLSFFIYLHTLIPLVYTNSVVNDSQLWSPIYFLVLWKFFRSLKRPRCFPALWK